MWHQLLGQRFGLGGGIGYSIPTGKYGFIDISPGANFVIQRLINRMWLDLHRHIALILHKNNALQNQFYTRVDKR